MQDKPILCSNSELRLIRQVLNQISRKRSKEVNPEMLQILIDNPEFTRLHLSLYYPFTRDDLEKYRDKLIWGSVRYTTFVWDIKQKPIEFAEIGLTFNANLFTLCSEEEFFHVRQIGREQGVNSMLTIKLPLHLAGELEDRYATTIMASHLQSPLLENFDKAQMVEDIIIAHELIYSLDMNTNLEALKALLKKYHLLAAYSKGLWDEFLCNYLNQNALNEIMRHM